MQSSAVIERIKCERTCGKIHAFIHARQAVSKTHESVFKNLKVCSDWVTTDVGYFENKLKEIIGKERAIAILTYLLSTDMAYNYPIMNVGIAKEMARQFIDVFREDARYFSNSTWNRNEYFLNADVFELGLTSWNSLSNATFDSGIILYDSERIGIVWIEDED